MTPRGELTRRDQLSCWLMLRFESRALDGSV